MSWLLSPSSATKITAVLSRKAYTGLVSSTGLGRRTLRARSRPRVARHIRKLRSVRLETQTARVLTSGEVAARHVSGGSFHECVKRLDLVVGQDREVHPADG